MYYICLVINYMSYIQRLADFELKRKLEASGALLIKGPKACGKTESAKQMAKSMVQLDRDMVVKSIMQSAPERILIGDTPRLIDEWQVYPEVWNLIKHEVDERNETGQFILTGSSNPEESVKMHSGAGRFTILNMRTMSWQELGYSDGSVNLGELLKGQSIINPTDEPVSLEFIVEKMIRGGFPGMIKKNAKQAADLNRAYVELLAEVDMSRVSGTRRDPLKVRSLLRSLARNTATTVEISTLEKDIKEKEKAGLTRPSIYDYMEALERLMILENQPAWNPHIRSSSALIKSPKRHFTDVALAVAAIGANEKSLLNDLNYTGFLFESLVIHELRVYGQVHDAQVFHYRDSSGTEIDAIVQKYDGTWSAFEIKLGVGQIDEAAASLHKFVSKLDLNHVAPPQSLNIITGTGISYTRKDGINVISIGSLGA